MSYSRLSQAQQRVLEPYVKGQSILDLGAEDLGSSYLLCEMGARDVLAVDRFGMPKPTLPNITTQMCQFHMLKDRRPVVFASWIVNWPVGLEGIFEAASTIIVVSKNTDSSACGYRQMWEDLSRREVLEYVPEFKNCLTIYGLKYKTRPYTGEEYAALHQETILSFDEAERMAGMVKRDS